MRRLLQVVFIALVLVACGPSEDLINFRYQQLPPELKQVVNGMETEFSDLSDKYAYLESEIKLAYINLLLQTRNPDHGVLELSGGLGYARVNGISAADGVKMAADALMGDEKAIFEFTGKPPRTDSGVR
jgi:hypothetical protein